MDVMAARKVLLLLCVLSSIGAIAFIWAYHLFVEDMEGIQYVITATSVIFILVTAVFIRPVIMKAPVEPLQDKVYKKRP
jgi:hypothetical protein